MKVIIAGSRTFNDYDFLVSFCDKALYRQDEIEIVSGCAKGADILGEQYAKEKGYAVSKFPADWETHGKKAGYVRNEEMAKYADALIAFWDRQSKGTKHMINLAKKHGLKIKVALKLKQCHFFITWPSTCFWRKNLPVISSWKAFPAILPVPFLSGFRSCSPSVP